MLDSIKSIFHITDEQLEEFTTDFVNRLPKYLQVFWQPVNEICCEFFELFVSNMKNALYAI